MRINDLPPTPHPPPPTHPHPHSHPPPPPLPPTPTPHPHPHATNPPSSPPPPTNHLHPLFNRPSHILSYSYFKIWPWKSLVKAMHVVKGHGHIWPSKFKGQGHGQGQTHWSHLRPGVHNRTTFGWDIANSIFDLENSRSKIMVKAKPDFHIGGLEFIRYVCFSFRGNRAIFGKDVANTIFDLEIQGQGIDKNRRRRRTNRYKNIKSPRFTGVT